MPDISSFQNIDGVISAIRIDASVISAPITRDVAEMITYDASFLRDGAFSQVTDMVPCDRRFSKARMISAKVDDMCTIRINRRTGDICLFVPTERDDLYDCDLNPIEVL